MWENESEGNIMPEKTTKNTQAPTPTHMEGILHTEEATVLIRKQMGVQVREGHTPEQCVKRGKREGNAVLKAVFNVREDRTPGQIVALALQGKI